MKNMKTIDLTPTWSALVPWMIQVLENPGAIEAAKAPLRGELFRLAAFADQEIARRKDGAA